MGYKKLSKANAKSQRKTQIRFNVSLRFKPTEQSATIATAEERCAAPPACAVDVTLGNDQSEVDISLYDRSKGIALGRRPLPASGRLPLVERAATQTPRLPDWSEAFVSNIINMSSPRLPLQARLVGGDHTVV